MKIKRFSFDLTEEQVLELKPLMHTIEEDPGDEEGKRGSSFFQVLDDYRCEGIYIPFRYPKFKEFRDFCRELAKDAEN